jgi:hypothetical protein
MPGKPARRASPHAGQARTPGKPGGRPDFIPTSTQKDSTLMHQHASVPRRATPPSPRATRRRGRWPALALGALSGVAVLLAGCGTSTPSAISVLQAGQQQFSSLTAFHFVLTTQSAGGPTKAFPFYPLKAEGDVALPDEVKSSLTISLGALDVTTQVIAIANQGWLLDPTSGKWAANSEIAGLASIFNAQTGLPSLVTQIESPTTPTDRAIGTLHCWSIDGTLSEAKVAALLGTTPPSTAPLGVSVCIGQSDHEVYLISLKGALFPGDTAQTEHDITLSKFNEAVTIAAPTT